MSTLTRGGAFALLATLVTGGLAGASVDAVITGVVEDPLLHPLAGATVVLHDSDGKQIARTTTGPDGRFTLPNVPFGDYTVEASCPGLSGDHQHLRIGSSENAAVELVCTNEEVIQIDEDWSVPAPPKATGSVATVTRTKLAELPGADDRPITDVVATQPGFVTDALGNVYARGNHANLQYQVDGIPVPDSVGSLFAATIPTRLVQGLEIYTGGMPAEFGSRLGAVVNLQTRRASDHPEGAVQVRYGSFETVEPGFNYSQSTEKVGMLVGGSYLYSQRALDPPSPDVILSDTGSTGRVFTRLDYTRSERDRVELFATYAHNRFGIPLDPTAQPFVAGKPRPVDAFGNEAPAFVPRDTRSTETEDELFAALSWVHTLDEKRGQLQIAPLYKLSRGRLFADAAHALGPTADPGATASDVDRTAHHIGAIAAYSLPKGNHLFKAGAQVDYLRGTTAFTAYARDDAMGQLDPTATVAGTDRTDALSSGIYIQDRWTLGKLALDLGLRGDVLRVMLEGGASTNELGASPRVGLSYAPDKTTSIHAFTGVLWQPPAPLDAANAARALGVVAPDAQVAYDLRPEQDVFAELGVTSKVARELSTGLTVWGRYAWNQLDDTAVGSTSLLSNYNFERGRAFGIEASFDVRVGPWLSGFGNVSFGLAEGRGIASAKYLFDAETLASNDWQTLDHAQLFTANAGVTIRDGRFAVSALMNYGSGLRTGANNDAHVPAHVRGDVSMQYTFAPRAYPIRIAVDIINVGDARYAYRIANGFVGSSFAPPRSVYLTLSVPLSPEPHHPGE